MIKLPNELIVNITSYLETKETLTLRRIDKSFQNIPVFLHKVTLKNPKNYSGASAIETLHHLFHNVTSIKQIDYGPLFLENLFVDIEQDSFREEFQKFLEDSSICSSFEEIYIKNTDKKLKLENILLLNQIIKKILSGCIKLEIYSGYRENFPMKIFFMHAQKIQNLFIDATTVTDSDLESLGELTQLTSLRINRIQLKEGPKKDALLSSKLHATLKKLSCLKDFNAYSDTINIEGIQALSENRNLTSLSIKIHNCQDNDLRYFFEKKNEEFPFPNLSLFYINFNHTSPVSPETIAAFKAARKTSIKNISIIRNRSIPFE